jgi:hypothetical protein
MAMLDWKMGILIVTFGTVGLAYKGPVTVLLAVLEWITSVM